MALMRGFLLPFLLSVTWSSLAATAVQERAPARDLEHRERDVFDTCEAFRAVIERAQRDSPTFQRQYRRLLLAGPIDIRIMVVESQRRSSVRARTAIARRGGAIVAADIYLPLSSETMELLAHEIEHVIEQLDRVDLAAHRHSGDVWSTSDGSVETRRAIEVGRRVAMETRAFVTPSVRRP
jgi:hypothetical protein